MAFEPSPFDTIRNFSGLMAQATGARPAPPAAVAGRPAAVAPAEVKPPLGRPAGAPSQFTTGKAADIGARFPLSEHAASLMTGELTPKRYVELLMEKSLYPDATRVLAFGLPKRDAVWWACLCMREAMGANPAPKSKVALEAAEKWAKRPAEENRRAGLKAAETAGFGTPAGLAALAAFWSGGSLTPPEAPVVPPTEDMTAEGVAGAVLLAAAGAAPDEIPKRQQRFLALGLAVAIGK